MVKNKALPDSARPCRHPRLVILSLSLSLSSPTPRLGPIKAGLKCLLSLSRRCHSSVSRGSCWGWTPACMKASFPRLLVSIWSKLCWWSSPPTPTFSSPIFRMHSGGGRCKAFSTCASHLTAIILFYSTSIYTYLRPTSSYSLNQDEVASVFYTVVILMLNSVIYSLQN